MLIKTMENKMRLQFKKVQKRANELGLGLARFNWTGVDANGEKIKYAYRMFVANKEEQSRFDLESRHGFPNVSGRFDEDLVQADYMSLIAVAHAIEGYALAGDKGLGVSQEDTYYLGGEFQTRKNIYTTYFAYNAEEMNERVGEYDCYCNDADINSSVLAEKVRKQY
jgi:hypothetical protein